MQLIVAATATLRREARARFTRLETMQPVDAPIPQASVIVNVIPERLALEHFQIVKHVVPCFS